MGKIKTESNIRKRILAGLIDYILIFSVTVILIYSLGESNEEGGYSLKGTPAFLPILFWLLMTVGLEIGFGATLGNNIVELKPIPKDGTIRKLSLIESLKRHLLDPIDMFLFGFVGIITIKNTDLHQRVGDLWAKTIVVPAKSFRKKIEV